MMLTKKIFFIILPITILLVIVRCALPTVLLYFVEKKINEIPGYKAKIESITINLYRGSYQINNIRLYKIATRLPVPFFFANVVDFQVQWQTLFRGRLVAQIKAVHPIVHFIIDPKGKKEQLTIDDHWRTVVSQLFPLPFNRVIILNGEVDFRSYTSKPPFNLYIRQITARLDNLDKVTNASENLFASLQAEGKAMDTASANLSLQFNPFFSNLLFY